MSSCQISHVRFYASLDLLYDPRGEAKALYAYALGLTRSFEFHPARAYFIPHYGLELGGLDSQELPHALQATPHLGLHLWAEKPIWLNLTAGLRVVPARLETLTGPRVGLTLLVDAI